MSNSRDENSAVNHFNHRAREWTALYQTASFVDRKNLFLRNAKNQFSASDHILDYGCGTGVLACALSKDGISLTGVDASEEMINVARQNAISSGSSAEFHHIDPDTWFEERHKFDGIICSSVLEYIQDDAGMFKRLSSVMDAGGVLLISIPNRYSLVGFAQDVVLKLKSILRPAAQKKDVHFAQKRYSRKRLEVLAQRADMRVEGIEYFELPKLGSWAVPISRSRFMGVMMLATCRKR